MIATKVEYVHFKVDFAWLTGFIRDLWAEGSYEHAYKVLDSSGLPDTRWADLLAGKIKFEQAPKNEDMAIAVPDNWTPNLDHCHYSIYPDPYRGLMSALSTALREKEKVEKKRWEKQELDFEIEKKASMFYGRLREEKPAIADPDLDDLDTLVNENLKSIFDTNLTLSNIQKSDQFYDYHEKNGLEPDVDFKYSLGYIDPQGCFWGCPFFAHSALLQLLGKSDNHKDIPEGWIKINRWNIDESRKFLVSMNIENNKPKKAQVDTLYRWAEKHGDDLRQTFEFIYPED